MALKILIDMNLPPSWAEFLCSRGFEAIHWSSVGDIRAPDTTLMAWARDHSSIVLTKDLDFSMLLAHTGAEGPSVLQVRSPDTLEGWLGEAVVAALTQHADALTLGALATLNEAGTRVRVLPLKRRPD